MERTNALAELAETLESIPPVSWYPRPQMDAIGKAVRIIAELAKVSDGRWLDGCGGMSYQCRAASYVVETTVGRCRAIAEEGANDE